MRAASELDRIRACFEGPPGAPGGVLERLFERERDVRESEVAGAIGRDRLDAMEGLGLLVREPPRVRALVRLARFRGQLIASDRHGYRRHADFVLGPGPASRLLADTVVPIPRGAALDLGCGPGSQTLWLADGAVEAVGIDISARALAFAAFNRDLNARARVQFRPGDFLTAPPDRALDDAFDLVVANPPFVLAPATDLTYRDRPLPGHDTTRVALERVLLALRSGGRGYVVGSWIDDDRRSWDAVPRDWVRGHGVSCRVTRASSQSAVAYATAWNRDLDAPARTEAIATWRRAFAAEGIERITTGVIEVARLARAA